MLIAPFCKVNYWDCNKTGSINDQQLANQVFDTAVNCGTGTVAKLLQKAAQVTVDLQVGPQTIAAVNKGNPETIYTAFIASKKNYYLAIIKKDPSQEIFRHSWFSRLPGYKTTA